MTANLHLRRPAVTVALFELLDPASATAETFNALTQAQLQLGELDAARHAIQAAKDAGISPEDQQVAILRGYRTLGYDADVEMRSRHDLAKLGLQPTAPFLNAIMRLRIDAGDLDGAEAVLGEFYFNGTDSGVEPIADTTVIALSIASRRGDLKRLHTLWDSLAQHPAAVSDHAVAQLCRALGRLGLVDQACGVLESSIHQTPSPWPLPANFTPSIKTANVVLDLATTTDEYEGLVRIAQLMREASIRPDSQTVTIVLEFARRNLVSTPTNLAQLLHDMLGRVSDTPSVDQLDVILSEAVRTAMQEVRRAELPKDLEPPPSRESTTDPTGGVEPRGELKTLLSAVITSLRDGGHQGTPRSLANRLLYDSLALDGTHGIPPARQVWNALVLRGYRAQHKHLLALLRGYAHVGAMAQAEDVAALARESGVPTSRAMYNALIGGWARTGNMQHARALYDQARRSPDLFDRAMLTTMVRSYCVKGQPSNAVAIAREDLAIVKPDGRCLNAVADAIRMANDVPGAIFFLAGATEVQTTNGKGWTLNTDIRVTVRRCLNYLRKQGAAGPSDTRIREAIELGEAMVAYDGAVRVPYADKPRLSKNTRKVLTSHFDPPEPANVATSMTDPPKPTK